MSDIDTAVVDGLKVLDPNGRLEKLPRRTMTSKVANDPSATLAVRCGNDFSARFGPYQSTRLGRYNAGP